MPAQGTTHPDSVRRTKHHAPRGLGPINPGRALAPRHRLDTSLTPTVRPRRPPARRGPTTRTRGRVNLPIALMQARAIMSIRRGRQTKSPVMLAHTTMRRAPILPQTVLRQTLDISFNSRGQQLKALAKLENFNLLLASHPASMPSREISWTLWPQQVKALALRGSTNHMRGSPNVIKQVPDIT